MLIFLFVGSRAEKPAEGSYRYSVLSQYSQQNIKNWKKPYCHFKEIKQPKEKSRLLFNICVKCAIRRNICGTTHIGKTTYIDRHFTLDLYINYLSSVSAESTVKFWKHLEHSLSVIQLWWPDMKPIQVLPHPGLDCGRITHINAFHI